MAPFQFLHVWLLAFVVSLVGLNAGAVVLGDGAALSEPWPPAVQPSPPDNCAARLTGRHTTYDVGPGQPLTELTDVPWLALQAGDVVNIHYRPEPYRTKFGLRAQGTADAPVVINGVTSGTCARPVISGEQAVTARDARMADFKRSPEGAGLILIHRPPSGPGEAFTPSHIVIQNLKLTGVRAGKSFLNAEGMAQKYGDFSAAIYALRVHNLTVENCEITGNSMGIFTDTKGDAADEYSANIIIRRNLIYYNGNPGRYYEHNLYIQARRALYEGNFIGQAYGGSSLKDRSSGTVIRYNKILASGHAMDLVETEEEQFKILRMDPLYPYAWVYGNIIINDSRAPAGMAVNMVHWGFDNAVERGRNGVLFFYHNTVVSRIEPQAFPYVVAFQIGREGLAPVGASVEAASNVFWQQSDNEWRFLSQAGSLKLVGTNYVPEGWVPGKPNVQADVALTGARLMAGLNPKLDAAGVPLVDSPVWDQLDMGPSFTPPGAIAENLRVEHQYKTGVGIVPRPASNKPGRAALGAMAAP